MDVTLPNGRVIRNVPEGTNKYTIMERAINAGLARPEDFGDDRQYIRRGEMQVGDPTGSGYQNFMAGAGKSVVDLGRGVRQIGAEAGDVVGLVSPETTAGLRRQQDEIAARDAPLMRTGAGIAGNITGTLTTTLLPAGLAARGAQAGGALRTATALRSFLNPGTIRAAAAAGGIQGALQPVGTQQSRLVNAGVGAALGAAAPVAAAGIRRVAQPVRNVMSAAGTRAVDVLRRAGVPLDVAQRTGSAFLNRVRSSLGDSYATLGRQRQFVEGQMRSFTRAVLRTIGANSDEATPAVINDAAERIGSVFTNIARNATIRADDTLADSLQQIASTARSTLKADEFGIISRQIDDILNAVQAGDVIDGNQFNHIRTTLGNLTRRSDVGEIAGELDDVLLNALERSAPDAAAALGPARAQWRNYRAILPAISNQADKYISPRLLNNRLHTGINLNLGRRGLGHQLSRDLVELAEAGATLIPDQLPNSGTTARAIAQLAAPAAIGAGIGYLNEGNLGGAVSYGLGGLALPILAQRAIQGQGGFANYLAQGMQGPLRNALMAPARTPGLVTAQIPAVAGLTLLE